MKKHNSASTMADATGRAFSNAEYRATYHKQKWTRGSASLPQRWALFREAKRRLEHGVPMGVLLRDVTWKLRAMAAHMEEVRHG